MAGPLKLALAPASGSGPQKPFVDGMCFSHGPSSQIAWLHQVLALKRLGLPLSRIAQILAGRDELDGVLALQEQVLARQGQSGAPAGREQYFLPSSAGAVA